MIVGARPVLLERELLARRHEKGALVAVVQEIVVGEERLVAAEALRQEVCVLTPVRHHPFDKGLGIASGRGRFPTIWLGNSPRPRRERRAAQRCASGREESSASQALTSLLQGKRLSTRISRQCRPRSMMALWRLNHAHRKAGKHCQSGAWEHMRNVDRFAVTSGFGTV